MSQTIRLGTRGSKLALAQAENIAKLFRPNAEVEIVVVKTSGDRGEREVRGAFVREIQIALLENRVDVALHCLKDLPTDPVEGLALAAHLPREDARDAMIHRFDDWRLIPEGAVVGTGSVRRTAQLKAIRPDLRFAPLVGNVDTRLRKLLDGEYDAIVLAMAGVLRLGLFSNWASSPYARLSIEPLPFDKMLPAPGQAVLVLETREGEEELVSRFDDPLTRAASRGERDFLAAFGGGCSVPVAAFAEAEGETVTLQGLVAAPDGSRVLRGNRCGATDKVGGALAAALEKLGARQIIGEVLR